MQCNSVSTINEMQYCIYHKGNVIKIWIALGKPKEVGSPILYLNKSVYKREGTEDMYYVCQQDYTYGGITKYSKIINGQKFNNFKNYRYFHPDLIIDMLNLISPNSGPVLI